VTTHAGATQLTTPGDREIRTERIFDAPRGTVWRAFTEPELLAGWWGRGNPVDVERMEVAPGGHWRYVEHAPEGAQGFEGRYRQVSAPELIVETFEWDGMPGYVSVSTIALEALDEDRTRVVTSAQFMTAEERDGMLAAGMQDGLTRSYDALDRLLASLG
jgi:uncharacterized protein YndB with AHSA1/START domain